MTDRHIPVVHIVTETAHDQLVSGRNTKITVDGQPWPTFAYKVEGGVDDVQRVTLTFAADITIERKDPNG